MMLSDEMHESKTGVGTHNISPPKQDREKMTALPAFEYPGLSCEEGKRLFNTPKDAKGAAVAAGRWLRVDGLSYIGGDTALFHIIPPASPAYRGLFSVQENRITAVGHDGGIYIAHLRGGGSMALRDAGYREGPVRAYFTGGEILVEPNPRGLTGSDIGSL